jgi:hypothetical protein
MKPIVVPGSRGHRPEVVHPKTVKWRGFVFQVVSFQPFTDEQALKVTEDYIRRNPGTLLKKNQGTVIEIHTPLSRDEAARLPRQGDRPDE